jgi:hypothetical protein
MLLFTLLLTTSAAAQDVSMVQGFAEGFTFHSHLAGNRRIDPSRTPSTSMKASAEPRW